MNLSASTRQTFIPDIQGSVLASLDLGSGALTKAGFQPFGESPSTAGTFRYTGARIDAETNGLYDFRARIYSPVLGRFLQPDPIGTHGGVNLYTYVSNDPLNNADPYGTYTLQVGLAGGINLPFGVTIPLGIGIAIDTQGHIGAYRYEGLGGQVGSGAEAGVSVQVSNANTISDLTGPFGNVSGHGGAAVGGSVDYFTGPSANGPVVGGGITIGAAAGASVSGAITNTSIFAPFGDGSTPTNVLLPAPITSATPTLQGFAPSTSIVPDLATPSSVANSSPSSVNTSSSPSK